MKAKTCRFLRSAARPEDIPNLRHPRVAFVGRSNVGKSSLLNRLVGSSGLARVSRTPGRTRLVNYFLVNDRLVLMDMPGYGYARVATDMRRTWRPLSEAALLAGNGTALTVLLIDGRHPPTDLDRQMAEWLDASGLDWVPVLTKFDKVKAAERPRALKGAAELACRRREIATSARTGIGMTELWREIVAAGLSRLVDEKESRILAGE